jgi:hypothetical protein
LPGVAEVVVIRFRVAASMAVIVAKVQLEERPKGEAEPAQRAGRVQCGWHLVLLCMPIKARRIGGAVR